MQKTTSKKGSSKSKTTSKATNEVKKNSTSNTDVSIDLKPKEISTNVKPKTKTSSKRSSSSKSKTIAKKRASSALKKQEQIKGAVKTPVVKEEVKETVKKAIKEPVKGEINEVVKKEFNEPAKKAVQKSSNKNINVTFIINNTSTSIGENIFISGNSEALGNWDINKAIKLNTDKSLYPTWRIDIDLPLNTEIEFKFLSIKGSGKRKDVTWENSENRILIVNENAKVYECSWK